MKLQPNCSRQQDRSFSSTQEHVGLVVILSLEFIPYASNSCNVMMIAWIVLDFPPQVVDMNHNGSGITPAVNSPDLII